MKNYLVKFSENWADEFDVDGFKIMNEVELSELNKRLETPITFYFGTNEGWDEEILEVSATELTDQEVAILWKLFPSCKTYGYGTFPSLEDLD